MTNQKVAVIGFTASGKTTYTLGMYNFMHDGAGNLNLEELDEIQHGTLFDAWAALINENKWPGLSDNRSQYTFSLQHALVPILNFEWIDYPGSVVLDVHHPLLDDFRKDLSEASCLLVLVNGESFAYEGNPVNQQKIQADTDEEYMSIVDNNLRNNHDLLAISALAKLVSTGRPLPPVSLVITKSDLIEDRWAHCLAPILIKSFKPIFGEDLEDERIVKLSAVTLGNIKEGKVNPVNVEEPISFAVLAVLLDRVRKERQQKQQAAQQLSEMRNSRFARTFQRKKIEQLTKEIEDRNATIQKMIKYATYMFKMFDPEASVYVNYQKTDLRTFFTAALNDSH